MNINVEDIKEAMDEDLFLDDDKSKSEFTKQNLRLKQNISGRNNIIFSELFLLSYNTFSNNIHKIEKREIKEGEKEEEGLHELIESFELISKNLRQHLEDYYDDIGSHIAEHKIKTLVNKHRDGMNELVILFQRVFLED